MYQKACSPSSLSQLRLGKVVANTLLAMITKPAEEEQLHNSLSIPQYQPQQISTQQEQNKPKDSPPFPKRLEQSETTPQPDFDFLEKIQNLCVKIPLIQAIKDVPIDSKDVRDLCLKKQGGRGNIHKPSMS